MKTEDQIKEAAKTLADAAWFSVRTHDKECYEVASTAVQILGWVLDNPEAVTGVEALLVGARWAQKQLLSTPSS